jgi:predicted dehydrogenase
LRAINLNQRAKKIGIVGAGNFASSTMIPSFIKAKAHIKYIASEHGLTAKILAKKAAAENATSDYHNIIIR